MKAIQRAIIQLEKPKMKGLTVEGGTVYFKNTDHFYTDFGDGDLYIIKNDKRLRKKYEKRIG